MMNFESGIFLAETDTIPGIFCNALNKDSVNRIFQIKNRPQNKPFAIFVSKVSDIWLYATTSQLAEEKAKALLPGPYTFILKANQNIKNILPEQLLSTDGFVGVRISQNQTLEKILQGLPFPLCGTSINKSGEQFATTLQHVKQEIKNSVDFILPSQNTTATQRPSTIIKIEENQVTTNIRT